MIMFQRNAISCKVVFVFFNVLMCTCFAVIVTVDDIVSVAEGDEARIMCNIVRSSSSSVAIPTVSWINVTDGVTDTIAQFQGGLGSVRSSYIDRFSVEGDTTLLIANTSRRDSGTYRCRVSITDDDPSPAHDDIMLSVVYLYKPVLSSFDTPVTEGDTVEMSCSADANPLPTYTFLRDGEEQQSGGSSTFTVQSVSRDNDGSYKCMASNSAGTKTSESRTLDIGLQFSPCADEPCENGGTCSVVEEGYNCRCNDHFHGLNCTNCIYKDGCDLDKGDTYYSDGNGVCGCYCGGCRQFDKNTNRCEICSVCSSSTSLTIGMLFVGIIVGAFGVIGGLIVYTRIKEKTKIDKRSTDKSKQDTYMDFTADRPTAGNENQTYQDLQYREEETAYVNVKSGKR